MTAPRPHTFGSDTGWWRNATTEQRLAQIDGGIELGMTETQVAKASGLHEDSGKALGAFARYHGRSFPIRNQRIRSRIGTDRRDAVARDRVAFISGERVDLWGTTNPQDEFALDEVTE